MRQVAEIGPEDGARVFPHVEPACVGPFAKWWEIIEESKKAGNGQVACRAPRGFIPTAIVTTGLQTRQH